jgi:Ring finger domain
MGEGMLLQNKGFLASEDAKQSKIRFSYSLTSSIIILLKLLSSCQGARRSFKEQSDFTENYYKAKVKDCSTNQSGIPAKHAKLMLSYTTLKDDPRVLIIGVFAKLLISVYQDNRVVNSGDVIHTYFTKDLNETMLNKTVQSYHKYGSMGWGDILIFERVDFNFTWLFPNNQLDLNNLNGGLIIRRDDVNRPQCLEVQDIQRFSYDANSLEFTIFYIGMVAVQIGGVIISIGLMQFNGTPFIKTLPRFSLVNSWTLDCQIILLSLVYLPCFIYAFIGQMFVVLFSMIATNPHFLMEGESDEMSFRKKVVMILISITIFTSQIYGFFWDPNNLPFYSLGMYLMMILDNFINYNREVKYVYIAGIYFPKSILVCYMFYYPNTLHMGPSNPSEFTRLIVYLSFALVVLAFQAYFHPRFYILTDYERELLKLVPKSMLIDDLLEKQDFTEDDVCGICLEPFGDVKPANTGVDTLSDSSTSAENSMSLGESLIRRLSVETTINPESSNGMEMLPERKTESSEASDTSSAATEQSSAAAPVQSSIEVKPAEQSKGRWCSRLGNLFRKRKSPNLPGALIDKTHCGHLFHRECLKSWTDKNENCPICREAVLQGL